jgi:hypothetical protein
MTADPDESRLFTAAEADRYNPRPCPDCGQHALVYPFVDVTAADDEGRVFLRARPSAATSTVRPGRRDRPTGGHGSSDLTAGCVTRRSRPTFTQVTPLSCAREPVGGRVSPVGCVREGVPTTATARQAVAVCRPAVDRGVAVVRRQDRSLRLTSQTRP